MGGFGLLVELQRKGSVPEACAAGLLYEDPVLLPTVMYTVNTFSPVAAIFVTFYGGV